MMKKMKKMMEKMMLISSRFVLNISSILTSQSVVQLVLVMMLTTPATASEPYKVDCPPFNISIRSARTGSRLWLASPE